MYELISTLSYFIIFFSMPFSVVFIILSELKGINLNFEFIGDINPINGINELKYILKYMIFGAIIISIVNIKIISPLINSYLDIKPIIQPELSFIEIIILFSVRSVGIPIFEELTARYFCYNEIKIITKRKRLSILIISILFGLQHEPKRCIQAFIFSIFVTSLYEKTNKIIVPIAFHGLMNFIGIMITLYIY